MAKKEICSVILKNASYPIQEVELNLAYWDFKQNSVETVMKKILTFWESNFAHVEVKPNVQEIAKWWGHRPKYVKVMYKDGTDYIKKDFDIEPDNYLFDKV